jgi:hypothetical protein
MDLIMRVNNENQGNEPFTRTTLWIPKATSGENGDGIRGVYIKRMHQAWLALPPSERAPLPIKVVCSSLHIL